MEKPENSNLRHQQKTKKMDVPKTKMELFSESMKRGSSEIGASLKKGITRGMSIFGKGMEQVDKVEREIGALDEIHRNPVTWYTPPVAAEDKTWLQRMRETCHKVTENAYFQSFVTLMIVMDLCLTIHSFIASEEEVSGIGFWITNFVIIMVLSMDVVLRLIVDGLGFFKKPMDLIEVLVVVICLVFFFLESGPKGVSLGRTLRPLFRVIKALRLASKAVVGQSKLSAKMNKLVFNTVHSFVESQLEGLLYLPKDHLTVRPSAGILYVQKTHVVSAAFDKLHLPFTVKGGLLELFRVDLGLEKKNFELPGLEVTLHNLLLVVGPGHHQVPPKPQWNYETVASAKKRMVDVLTQRLESQIRGAHSHKQDNTEDDDGITVEPQEKKGLMGAFMKRIKNGLMSALLARVSIKIKNIAIRYEDDCELQDHAVLGTFKVGAISLFLSPVSVKKSGRSRSKENPPTLDASKSKLERAPSKKNHIHEVISSKDGSIKKNNSISPLTNSDSPLDATQSPSLSSKISSDNVFQQMQGLRSDGTWRVFKGGTEGQEEHFDVSINESKGKEKLKGQMIISRVSAWWSVDVVASKQHFTPELRSAESIHNAALRFKQEDLKDRLQVACMEHIVRPFGAWRRAWSYGYLLQPMHASVHMALSKPDDGNVPQEGSDFWHPARDIDVQLQTVNLSIQRKHLLSLIKLVRFTDHWHKDNEKFQWRPRGLPGDVKNVRVWNGCTCWWPYALWGLQKHVGRNLPWKFLPLLNAKRKHLYRFAYRDLFLYQLESVTPDKLQKKSKSCLRPNSAQDQAKDVKVWTMKNAQHMVELTVALPIPDLVRARTEAYNIFFHKQAELEDEKKQTAAKIEEMSRELEREMNEDLEQGRDVEDSPRSSNSSASENVPEVKAKSTVPVELAKVNPQHSVQFKVSAEYVSMSLKTIPEGRHEVWDSIEIVRFAIRGFDVLFCTEAPIRIQLEMVPNMWESVVADDSGLNNLQKTSIESMLEKNQPIEWIIGVLAAFGVSKTTMIRYLQSRQHTSASGWLGLQLSIDLLNGIDCTLPSSAVHGRKFLCNAGKTEAPVFRLRLKKSPNLEILNTQQDLTWSLAVELQPVKITIHQPLIGVLKEVSKIHEPVEVDHDWLEVQIMRAHLEPRFQFHRKHSAEGKLFEALCGAPRQKWEILLSTCGVDCTLIAPFSRNMCIVQHVFVPAGRCESCRYGFVWPPPFFSIGLGNEEEVKFTDTESSTGAMALAEQPAQEGAHLRTGISNTQLRSPRTVHSRWQCLVGMKSCKPCCTHPVEEVPSEVFPLKMEELVPADVFDVAGSVSDDLQTDPQKSVVDDEPFDYHLDMQSFWLEELVSKYQWTSAPMTVDIQVVRKERLGLPVATMSSSLHRW